MSSKLYSQKKKKKKKEKKKEEDRKKEIPILSQQAHNINARCVLGGYKYIVYYNG